MVVSCVTTILAGVDGVATECARQFVSAIARSLLGTRLQALMAARVLRAVLQHVAALGEDMASSKDASHALQQVSVCVCVCGRVGGLEGEEGGNPSAAHTVTPLCTMPALSTVCRLCLCCHITFHALHSHTALSPTTAGVD